MTDNVVTLRRAYEPPRALPLPMVTATCTGCQRPHASTPLAAARYLFCPFCGDRLPRWRPTPEPA